MRKEDHAMLGLVFNLLVEARFDGVSTKQAVAISDLLSKFRDFLNDNDPSAEVADEA